MDHNKDRRIGYWVAVVLLLPILLWQKFLDTYKIESFCVSSLIVGAVTYWVIGYLTWRGIT